MTERSRRTAPEEALRLLDEAWSYADAPVPAPGADVDDDDALAEAA
jgi:hypothetical protein